MRSCLPFLLMLCSASFMFNKNVSLVFNLSGSGLMAWGNLTVASGGTCGCGPTGSTIQGALGVEQRLLAKDRKGLCQSR